MTSAAPAHLSDTPTSLGRYSNRRSHNSLLSFSAINQCRALTGPLATSSAGYVVLGLPIVREEGAVGRVALEVVIEELEGVAGGDLLQDPVVTRLPGPVSVSYTHLTLPTIYSV